MAQITIKMKTPDYNFATNEAYRLVCFVPWIHCLPNVFDIARSISNCSIKPYSSVPSDEGEPHIFESVSKHGFLAGKPEEGKYLIFYNDKDPYPVIRFTVAHELGHFVLGHSDEDGPAAEKEANCFARNLLCPLPVADYFQLCGIRDYSRFFMVSRQMAGITLAQRHHDRELIQQGIYDSIRERIDREARVPSLDEIRADRFGNDPSI